MAAIAVPIEVQRSLTKKRAHTSRIFGNRSLDGGAPFFAINGHLRQELNYSGNLIVQAGWAWRGDHTGYLLRTELHYYNGLSNQYSFFRNFEQQIGAGVWLDF